MCVIALVITGPDKSATFPALLKRLTSRPCILPFELNPTL